MRKNCYGDTSTENKIQRRVCFLGHTSTGYMFSDGHEPSEMHLEVDAR